MDLKTTYMGYKLRSPLVASASPLSETVDGIKRLEDAGAGAVVMFSLFEEQLRQEQLALHHYLTYGTESHPEALAYFPEPKEFRVDSRGYLELIRKAKAAVDIPIIASLNGTTPGNWVKFARQIEDAGADGRRADRNDQARRGCRRARNRRCWPTAHAPAAHPRAAP